MHKRKHAMKMSKLVSTVAQIITSLILLLWKTHGAGACSQWAHKQDTVVRGSILKAVVQNSIACGMHPSCTGVSAMLHALMKPGFKRMAHCPQGTNNNPKSSLSKLKTCVD